MSAEMSTEYNYIPLHCYKNNGTHNNPEFHQQPYDGLPKIQWRCPTVADLYFNTSLNARDVVGATTSAVVVAA